VIIIGACTPLEQPHRFDPRTCLTESPQEVEGLEILHGQRTAASIAADMQDAYCNGQVLLKLMNENNEPVSDGTVWFKVVVEYTGEVISVITVKSDISSKKFLRKVSDMINDTDFSPWLRDDQDVEFIFPMTFTRWWE
jgi:hypothetical protein